MVSNKFISFYTFLERRNIYIPCRPSFPGVEVALLKILKTGQWERLTNVTFDPKRGVYLHNVSTYAGGRYKCQYSYGNTTVSKDVILTILHDPKSRGVAAPFLTAYENDNDNGNNGNYIDNNNMEDDIELSFINRKLYLKEGASVRLVCNASLEAANKVKLSWTKNGEPLHFCNDVSSSSSSFVTRDLLLSNITIHESDKYSCVVNNHVGENNSEYVEIIVADEKQEICHLDHVLFTEHLHGYVDCAPVSAALGETVKLSMARFKNSEYVDFHWYDPMGNRQSCETPRSKYSCTSDKTNLIINIKQVSLADSGRYSFSCIADQQPPNKPIEFCLEVGDQPRLRVELADHKFDALRYSQSQVILCKFTAYPPPDNITWTICQEPEPEVGNCLNFSMEFENITTNNNEYVSKLEVWPEQLGWTLMSVQCSGSNILNGSETEGESDKRIIPAVDYEPPVSNLLGFCIIQSQNESCAIQTARNGSEIEVYESQSLLLACGQHGTHQNKQVWKVTKSGKTIRTKLWKQNITDGPSSFINKLVLDDVAVEESGLYSCFDKFINITVNNFLAPEPLLWDMDNATQAVNLSDKVVLNCDVTGDPEPTILWRKDDFGPREFKPDLEDGNYTDPLELDSVEYNGTSLIILHFHTKHVGTYTCIRENLGGRLVGSKTLKMDKPGAGVLVALVGVFSFISVVLTILFSSVLYYVRKHKRAQDELTQAEITMFLMGDPGSISYTSANFQDQVSLLPYDSCLEFSKERLKLGKQIGVGAFGRVLKAEALGIEPGEVTTTVAVKTLKTTSGKCQLQALMSEIKILSHLGHHPNILHLLGAITQNLTIGEIYLIVEYCKFGNIQKFILNNRKCFIDQINPGTGKFDCEYPPDITEKLDVSRGYNEHLNYASLSFENRPPIAKPTLLTKANLEAHAADNKSDNMHWRKQLQYNESSEGEELSSLIHNKLSVKDSGVSTDSEFPDQSSIINTESSYITSRGPGVDYCEVFPTYSKLMGREESAQNDYVHEFGPLTTRHLLSWSFQIAKGMEYLASKKIVHGDLAARNILLNEAGIVKISDFGLSKNIYNNPNYQKMTDSPLPIKWLALETLNYRIFSVQSDVWSYGIVLWEMFSLGRAPYPGMEQDQSFTQRLEQGMRMDKPEFSTKELYKVMLDCWHADPSMRPSFQELTEKIHEEMTEGLVESYLKLGNVPEINANTQEAQNHQGSVPTSGLSAGISNPEYYTSKTLSL